MLPAAARIRAATDFASAARRGYRGSSPTVVVHLLVTDRAAGARAGFVVSKRVGNSVVRHRVTRRLRPLVRVHLPELPPGADLVVRALPAAADAPSRELSADLASALRGAARRAGSARAASVSGWLSMMLTATELLAPALICRVPGARRRPSPLAWLLILPIRFYQRFITPYTPATCRYYPTCSSYAVQALRTHGAVKGTVLTAWRLLRCNPWSSGGVDQVPPRGRWHGEEPSPAEPEAGASNAGTSDAGTSTPGGGVAPEAVGVTSASPVEQRPERPCCAERSDNDLSGTARPAGSGTPNAGRTAA